MGVEQSLTTDEVQGEVLTAAKSIDAVQQAAEGEIEVTKPQATVAVEVEDIPTTTTAPKMVEVTDSTDVSTTTAQLQVSPAHRTMLSDAVSVVAVLLPSLLLLL